MITAIARGRHHETCNEDLHAEVVHMYVMPTVTLTFSFQLPAVSVMILPLHAAVKKSGASWTRQSAMALPSLTLSGSKVRVPPSARQFSSWVRSTQHKLHPLKVAKANLKCNFVMAMYTDSSMDILQTNSHYDLFGNYVEIFCVTASEFSLTHLTRLVYSPSASPGWDAIWSHYTSNWCPPHCAAAVDDPLPPQQEKFTYPHREYYIIAKFN